MKRWLKQQLSQRQYEIARMAAFEVKRWWCRCLTPRIVRTNQTQLHLGSGDRVLTGWLNVDMVNSDANIDLAMGRLPFPDSQFQEILTQHVVEHLSLHDELIPLMRECHRCLMPGGKLWISTPDMEKICRSYLESKCEDMIRDRKRRLPGWELGNVPPQHFLNDVFYQQSEHRNLFDFELLEWVLKEAGFSVVSRTTETDLISSLRGVPPRFDEYQSLYVCATKRVE